MIILTFSVYQREVFVPSVKSPGDAEPAAVALLMGLLCSNTAACSAVVLGGRGIQGGKH